MGKFIKRLFLLAFVCGLLTGVSYLGVRSVAGRFLGTNTPDMGTRTIKLAYDSVPGSPGKQPVWIFTYAGTKLPGARNARIYISVTGHLILTVPKDLDTIIDQTAKAREPS
ncbi:MAG TPA: hypothetical protein VGI83_00820 [Gemmatimonadales bacterium]|jgi:hypothetical protein